MEYEMEKTNPDQFPSLPFSNQKMPAIGSQRAVAEAAHHRFPADQSSRALLWEDQFLTNILSDQSFDQSTNY